jgi:UDPglucose--hexose-1-phosphate uridylyltransferase
VERPSAAHRRAHGAASSLVRAMIAEERREARRVVEDDGRVVSYCPYASPRAWWVRLSLDADVPRFSQASDTQLAALAARLPTAVRRALGASGATDYNVYVADPPVGHDGGFVIEILPRTGGDAGFEVSTGTSVCVVLPEDAADRMRALGPMT